MLTWNYNPPDFPEREKEGLLQEHFQPAYSQTLLTMFNYAARNQRRPLTIRVPKKMKPLIESLLYHNEGMIGDIYLIKYIDYSDNTIAVGNCPLRIENYPN